MSKHTLRIHRLPPQLANQIAAGEVVERPASVVKELLENSLDAGADEINIDLTQGGIDRIHIQDNGCGIHPDDMLLALSQHATSKITRSEDLARIMSLGFRGEALASISAVSHLTLTAAQKNSAHAWRVQNGVLLPAAHPQGCSLEVCDLFYNVPARRKFLRSARSEWQYTEEVIKRILLSRYAINFSVVHNGKKWLYPAIKNDDCSARIAKVFSTAFTQVAHAVDAQAIDLQLSGFVAPSDFTRSSYDWQYFYVNGRMVKDKLIQHALRSAFGECIYPGRYPAYVLYLTLDPASVDVNVHPTKHEVRFQQTRLVHDFIVNSVQRSLQASIFPAPALKSIAPVQAAAAHQANVYSALLTTPQPRKLGTYLTVLNQQIIITETAHSLGLVDLHAYYAHQAYIVFTNKASQTIRRQHLLSPYAFKVSSQQDLLLSQQQSELQVLGFILDPLGTERWALREIPAVLAQASMLELTQTLLTILPDPVIDIAQLACCAIPQAGLALSGSDIERILDNVEALPSNVRCPHGLKIWQLWSLNDLREAASCKRP